MSFDWVGICGIPLATSALTILIVALAARRSPSIAVAALFICLSSGVMLWMMSDFFRDPYYNSDFAAEDWFLTYAFTLANVAALVTLLVAIWRFNHILLIISAGLSTMSIIFPFAIIAGFLAWRDRRNEPRRRQAEGRITLRENLRGGRMDLLKIAQLMEANGFRNVTTSSEFEGVQFQIVGTGSIGLQKMPVLIRTVSVLDESAARKVAEEFMRMHKKKQSYVFGKFFLYCLLTGRRNQEATDWLVDTLYMETHRLKATLGGGGGHFLMADEDSGWGYVMETKDIDLNYERKMANVLLEAGLIHAPEQKPEQGRGDGNLRERV